MIKRQSYESWRITYQDPEHAARAAYKELMKAHNALEYYADRNKYHHPVNNSHFLFTGALFASI